jgi:hypothetical protein
MFYIFQKEKGTLVYGVVTFKIPPHFNVPPRLNEPTLFSSDSFDKTTATKSKAVRLAKSNPSHPSSFCADPSSSAPAATYPFSSVIFFST